MRAERTRLPEGDHVVDIVIVSFNTRDLLRECLASIEAHAPELGRPVRVIVADNASSDGSPAMVRDEFPGVTLVPLDENLGFGAGNNRGAAAGNAPLILFLNSGVRFLIGVMLRPLIDDFDWSRSAISAAVFVNMAVYAVAVIVAGRLYAGQEYDPDANAPTTRATRWGKVVAHAQGLVPILPAGSVEYYPALPGNPPGTPPRRATSSTARPIAFIGRPARAASIPFASARRVKAHSRSFSGSAGATSRVAAVSAQ